MRKIFRYIKKHKWQVTFYLVLLFVIIQVVLYSVYFFQKKKLLAEINDLNFQISEVDNKIKQIKEDENVKKYLILVNLNQILRPTIWSDVMKSMMDIYLKINQLSNGSFKILSFNINMSDLNLQGEVASLEYIYKTNGLLDQFEKLDFITHMNIPFYKKMGNYYQFSLNAKIKINGTAYESKN